MRETEPHHSSAHTVAQEIQSHDSSLLEQGTALEGSTAVIVLGMHRSGTSALAGTLHHLGVELGEHLMPASPDNPRGYWEHRDIVTVNHGLMAELGAAWDDLRPLPANWERGEAALRSSTKLVSIMTRHFAQAPLWGLKDPRLCRLLPLWTTVLAQLKVKPRFILALRHPRDVAASLAARDGLSEAHAGLLWLRHVLEAERSTRGRLRTIVHYEDLVGFQGWRRAASQIAGELDLSWPAERTTADAAIDDYLAPELRRNRVSDVVPLTSAPQIHPWIEAVYSAFRFGAGELSAVCDRVRHELEIADQLFVPVIEQTTQRLVELRTLGQQHDGELAELRQCSARAEQAAGELRQAAARNTNESTERKPGKAAVTVEQHGQPPPIAVEEAFPRWIVSRETTAVARADWVAERVAQWTSKPKLALGMILPMGSEARVALTLRSLLAQTAGDWILHIAAEGEMPEPFASEERLAWHRADGSLTELLNGCLLNSDADWVALIDAGDQLAPHALFSLAEAFFRHSEWLAVYSDEDRTDLQDVHSGPHFKPDFNLDLMRSLPYVGGLLALRRNLFEELRGFEARWDGAEEYDLALRVAERAGAAGFGHIADILYHRLTISGRSRRQVAEICADLPKIVQAHLDRSGIAATAQPGPLMHSCRVQYRHAGPDPLVSIIVPTKNQLPLLKRCVEAVLQITEYQNYELIIVDNGSTAADAREYLQKIDDRADEIGGRLRVLRHPGAFNFSAINNRAVREAALGEYICLLNNDAAPLEGAWLDEMMMLARRPDVGAVGAKLFFPDGRIQHGGVILGVGWGSPADHPYIEEPGNALGYWGRLQVVQDFSAVTAACLVTRRSIYDQVGGLDERAFAVSYNDVDYCLKVRGAGYLVAWTPFARLLHETSASLRADVEAKPLDEKNARFKSEGLAMYRRWMPQIAFDPAYNRNLSSFASGFAVETESAPTWDPDFRPRPRVLVYPADREGCGEYRIIAPSRALFKSGLAHSYETMRLLSPPEVARMAPDSVVFQRQLEWGQIDTIERVKNTSAAFRIFELDDLITNLPPKSIHRPAIHADIGYRLKKALSLCDRLVVSTEPLARSYGRLCDEVLVLPNRLEKRRWLGLNPKRRLEGKPRVGWAGAVGHTGDLALVTSVVEATAKEVDWIFFGMCPDRLRPFLAEYHEWVPLQYYARKLASLDLDLAIAPLEPHPFNECKSNLRVLEYGVLGYPVLCTDILPYQGDLPVFRVSNRHHAWTKAIRDMVSDRETCRHAGQRLREVVLENWMLEDHLDEWKRAWLP
jgi:O-antigen biosynthesis protein